MVELNFYTTCHILAQLSKCFLSEKVLKKQNGLCDKLIPVKQKN